MGIYDSGIIYGIKIYNFNNDGIENILLEKIKKEVMSDEEKKEIFDYYDQLEEKKNISFLYYTECSSTYGKDNYLAWYPMSINLFIQKFGNLKNY